MNLTKKQIRETSTLSLAFKFNELIMMGETMDAKDIPINSAKELIWVEEELQRRAIKAVGHDFYPPPHKEKPPQRSAIKSCLKSNKSSPKATPQISFKVKIITSLGSKAGEFRVEACSKSEAEKKAHRMIWKMGLKGARCKIL